MYNYVCRCIWVLKMYVSEALARRNISTYIFLAVHFGSCPPPPPPIPKSWLRYCTIAAPFQKVFIHTLKGAQQHHFKANIDGQFHSIRVYICDKGGQNRTDVCDHSTHVSWYYITYSIYFQWPQDNFLTAVISIDYQSPILWRGHVS